MDLLKSFFARARHTSQAQVVRRAGVVIDRVIQDVGVDSLVAGTFVLEKSLRLRFTGVALARWPGVIASVPVSQIAEANLLRGIDATEPLDLTLVTARRACLAHAVVRELGSRSPALRALPATEA
jgi:hypothetical protein